MKYTKQTISYLKKSISANNHVDVLKAVNRAAIYAQWIEEDIGITKQTAEKISELSNQLLEKFQNKRGMVYDDIIKSIVVVLREVHKKTKI